jgi:cytochrome c553
MGETGPKGEFMIAGASLASALALLVQRRSARVSRSPPTACKSCHGAQLQGGFGRALAGRPAGYILQRLAHYVLPQGNSPSMRMVATSLTPAERQALAAYIAHLPTPAASRPAG